MGPLAGIFIVGFIVLGIYKYLELFAKRKERIMFIEKFFENCDKKDLSNSFPKLPVSFESTGQNFSYWSLRFSLLLTGIGIGCLLAFLTANYFQKDMRYDTGGFIIFAYISTFGGIGLLASYLIELFQSKKK
jgi:hypothetical protein